MNFGMIILNQSIKTKQNYATWILTALLFTLKPNNFLKTLVIMLKNGLTHLATMKMIKDCFQQIRTKVIGLFKDELAGNIIIEFVGLRTKTYAYLRTKFCVIK